MYPVVFSVGPFILFGVRIPAVTIYSYGVMMALGFLGAAMVTSRLMARRGMNPELAWSLVVWAAVGGLVGARLLSIIDDWQSFTVAPLQALFSGSGFVWYGGLLGGVAASSLFISINKLRWLEVVDSASPGLALGQALGRIGCQLAGDGDWGKPTSVPWAMSYPNAINDYWNRWIEASGLPPTVKVHPTPIYESLAYLAAFFLLLVLARDKRPSGSVFWWYLVLVGGARFGIEYLRINPPWLFGHSQAQLISLALVSVGVVNLARQHLAGNRHGEENRA